MMDRRKEIKLRNDVIRSTPVIEHGPLGNEDWLDLQQIARVEVTSEHHEYPIEFALDFGKGPGWRAGGRGEQAIRLIFVQPQRLSRIWLRFVEREYERTQEFALRWWEQRTTGPRDRSAAVELQPIRIDYGDRGLQRLSK
jgi:hypothetical protein